MKDRDKKVGLVLLGFLGACAGIAAYKQSQADADEREGRERLRTRDEDEKDDRETSPAADDWIDAPRDLRARIDRSPRSFFRREMTPAEYADFVESPRIPIVLAAGRDDRGRKHHLLGDWGTGRYVHTIDEGDGTSSRVEPYRAAPDFIRVL